LVKLFYFKQNMGSIRFFPSIFPVEFGLQKLGRYPKKLVLRAA